jgi:hypothetical protein
MNLEVRKVAEPSCYTTYNYNDQHLHASISGPCHDYEDLGTGIAVSIQNEQRTIPQADAGELSETLRRKRWQSCEIDHTEQWFIPRFKAALKRADDTVSRLPNS